MRIEKEDGFARICEFDGIETPYIIDLRGDFKFLDKIERKPPEILKKIKPELFEEFHKENEIKKIVPISLYSSDFFKAIYDLRSSTEAPLYISSCATPQNLSLLVYLGGDFFDNALALRKAFEGLYLTEVGEFELRALKTLPCNCEACLSRDRYKSDFEFLADHNTNALLRELNIVKEAIRNESLRELVESRVRTKPETTAVLRLFDANADIQKFPRFRRSNLYPTTEDSFNRPEIRYYFKRLEEIYDPVSPTALILPCSAVKPYLLSKTHRRIRSALGDLIRGINEIIVSSPFVAPRELELIYPIAFYNTPTTGIWSEWEIDFVAKKLAGLLEKFENVIAFVHNGYKRVVERSARLMGIDVTFADDFNELRSYLNRAEREDFDLYREMFRHMLRYQFGVEFESKSVRGKYPNLEFFNEERIARVDMRYGNLDVYFELAEYLLKKQIYTVEIEDFDVKGTIFSKGVIRADEKIKPNDVVVYYSSYIIGVGQAVISGREMGKIDGKAIISRRKKLI
uniref:PUA domain-containing protein n=3 Tax=Geoglobus ahangari TaxID=113653 RepID=A0A7C3UL03_9EURY